MLHDVSVNIASGMRYPHVTPFHPSEEYPEWGEELPIAHEANPVYGLVRDCIKNLGLDAEHQETAEWNPFGEFITPGDRVLIKPNLVLHFNGSGADVRAVTTHGSVIRPVLDYVIRALKGKGQIIVGDAPQANGHFDAIVSQNGLREVVAWYQAQGMPIELLDFRKNFYPDGTRDGVREELPGDPNGYVLVDLGKRSFLEAENHLERLYGSDFDRSFIVERHRQGHQYLLSGSVLQADVIICMPKLKTHRKTGVTINCKNMVGANGDKNYLAHYRVGNARQGGDEYPPDLSIFANVCYRWDRIARDHILVRNTMGSRYLYKMLNKPFSLLQKIYQWTAGGELLQGHGDWYGNDTTWRMCLDLNQIVLFADQDGILHDTPQRKYFSVVDGIVAGEADGPLSPTPKAAGYVACGMGGPFAVDYVAIYQMGFDPERLKVNREAQRFPLFSFHPSKLDVICMQEGNFLDYREVNLLFKPQRNWAGHVER